MTHLQLEIDGYLEESLKIGIFKTCDSVKLKAFVSR
jgi:hypothetical protein